MSIGLITGIGVLVLVAIGVVVRVYGRPSTAGSALRWVALVLAVGIAALLLPAALSDSGAFGYVLVGLPVLAALFPLLAQHVGRLVPLVSAMGAAVMLCWGLLLGLGLGLYFVLPAVMLGLAAAVTPVERRNDAVQR